MCWLKRNKKLKDNLSQDTSAPPEPQINSEAVVMIWNEAKNRYYEIYQKNGIYTFTVFELLYEDMDVICDSFYYWTPLDDRFAHFFDTKEKAIAEAENVMKNSSAR